jgi:hypothetical protein
MEMWERSKPMCSEHTLKNFIESFVQEHTLSSGGEMVLDVSPEDIQALGDFFVRGICGWALGLKTERKSRKLVEVTGSIELSESLDEGREKSSEGIEREEIPIN